ncbi:hypothetical protein ACTA71_004355 [Dictyostelium dimigraforme]
MVVKNNITKFCINTTTSTLIIFNCNKKSIIAQSSTSLKIKTANFFHDINSNGNNNNNKTNYPLIVDCITKNSFCSILIFRRIREITPITTNTTTTTTTSNNNDYDGNNNNNANRNNDNSNINNNNNNKTINNSYRDYKIINMEFGIDILALGNDDNFKRGDEVYDIGDHGFPIRLNESTLIHSGNGGGGLSELKQFKWERLQQQDCAHLILNTMSIELMEQIPNV